MYLGIGYAPKNAVTGAACTSGRELSKPGVTQPESDRSNKLPIGRRERAAIALICRAQVASDAGKGFATSRHNSVSALLGEYDAKKMYINQAVVACRKTKILVSNDGDVIYFEWVFAGEIQQVSFHFFHRLPVGANTGSYSGGANYLAVWNGIKNGSRRTCAKFSKILQLNII